MLLGAVLSLAVAGCDTPAETRPAAAPAGLACLGRIEPLNGVARLSARPLSGQRALVGELLVEEGEAVEAGQVLAMLDHREQLEATVREMEANVTVAERRLAVVLAGPKPGDLAAQEAEVVRLEAQLADSLMDMERYDWLFHDRIVAEEQRDDRRTLAKTTEQQLVRARNLAKSVADVRAVDVALARAEVEAAAASLARARADLAASAIKAPYAGTVLKVHAYPGEEVGPRGILEFGRTDAMYVVAEVPQSDARRLEIGQRALIETDALDGELSGRVEYIGMTVSKNDVLHLDPASLSDARVIEVKIRLDDPERAQRLIYCEVTVRIDEPQP